MDNSAQKILMVDDEPAITEGICEALELQGYHVAAAFDGQQALDAIERDCPDLVVMDVRMPRVDGLQVLKLLRSAPETRDLPVILLTGLGTDQQIVEGIKSGATMYLTKPVELAKVTALVAAILGPRRA
ncbi:MAG: response regulator [Armatimonadetes bacterium]|jgi:DNA-binding response OmpR family regulator|nr:response regulator [Armatimonadota bacterium]